MLSRRVFLIQSSLAALGAGCGGAAVATQPVPPPYPGALPPPPPQAVRPVPEPTLAAVLGRALDEAKRAGATYADARVHQRRHESIRTREDHVTDVTSTETYGLALRVLAFGAWGFASSP